MNLNKKEKSAARKRAFRNSQTDEAKADASAQLQARMSALRNSQTEEEKDLASGQLRARMSELRAERKEASDLDTRIVKLEAATHDVDSDDEKFDKENFEAEVNAHYRNTPNERPPEHLFKYFDKTSLKNSLGLTLSNFRTRNKRVDLM
jgi:hypothetical protein